MAVDSFSELVEKYRKEYPWKYLKKFPEFAMKKLEKGAFIPSDLVQPSQQSVLDLKPLEERDEENDRDIIIRWIGENLDHKTLMYIGW